MARIGARFERGIGLLLVLILLGGIAPARAQLMKERPELMAAVGSPSLLSVKPGGSFTARLRFRIKSGAWYYGPKPGGKVVQAQPAVLSLPTGAPFRFGPIQWPKTTIHLTDLGNVKEKYNVYVGDQNVSIPVKVLPNAAKKAYPLLFTFSGQVCTDQGMCIPLKAPAALTVQIADADAPNSAPVPTPTLGHPAGTGSGPFGGNGSLFPRTGLAPSGGAGSDAASLPGGGFDVTRLRGDSSKTSWALALLFAFLGGLIMNVMPCVLPVVPIKVYSFLEHARQDPRRARNLSLAFAGGMIAVFLALGGIMASVRGLWGAQFQSPVFVTALGAIMFLMALWLLGAFTLILPQTVAGARASGGDVAGAFGMGALATVLATPCSGPFLGGALAWAVTQPAALILLTFAAVGVGMASPYVLLVSRPALLKRLPRPGPWMETFKQAMALVMFGVSVYFVSVLPAEMHVPFLMLCLALGAGAWVLHEWGGLMASNRQRAGAGIAALVLALIGIWQVNPSRHPAVETAAAAAPVDASGLSWTPFDVNTLNGWLSGGENVVVEWTADWCPNCKYIEATVYHQSRVVNRLKGSVKLMRADITRSSPQAEQVLQNLGSQSIPFSVVFRGSDPTHPVLLRDIYTGDQLLTALGPGKVAERP